MEFLSFEAEEENGNLLVFWDNEQVFETNKINNFIDDTPIEEEDVIFYRERNPLDVNDYLRFNGQTRNPLEAVYEDAEHYYGQEDSQPELYASEDRNSVTFDKFEGFENSIDKFKKTFANFPESKNQLFDVVIFGLMFTISKIMSNTYQEHIQISKMLKKYWVINYILIC